MKYARFNKNSKADYNLLFIYEDKLSSLNKSVLSNAVFEDVKLALSNKDKSSISFASLSLMPSGTFDTDS